MSENRLFEVGISKISLALQISQISKMHLKYFELKSNLYRTIIVCSRWGNTSAILFLSIIKSHLSIFSHKNQKIRIAIKKLKTVVHTDGS